MTRMREIALMLLTAAIIFFAGQNLGPVDVEFLLWHFQVPLALIALVPLLAGLVIGVAGTALRMRGRQRATEPPLEEETESPEGEAEEEFEDDETSAKT